MYKGTIEFHGKEWDDVLAVIEDAYNVLRTGYMNASGSVADGTYTLETIERPEDDAT